MTIDESAKEQIPEEKILLATFLEQVPPGAASAISDLCTWYGNSRTVAQPDIQLHCDSDTCQGIRMFFSEGERQYMPTEDTKTVYMRYRCRNCRSTEKIYAFLAKAETETSKDGVAIKLGEFPSFGPPVPSRVITLIGPDRDVFLRGRRAENHGLGIGAFAYYRRVVENQKGRLITEIAKVAKRLGATPEELTIFENAAKETQFSKAIEDIKDAIPQVLRINGHNPLTLLHSALSEGLHARSDGECLELATSIRVVLTELSERISQALKDEAEIRNAITKLMQIKQNNI